MCQEGAVEIMFDKLDDMLIHYEELMRIKDKGEKTTIYLKQDKNKKKEFVLMTGEKNEFTVIIITGNLTLKEIQGIVNKE